MRRETFSLPPRWRDLLVAGGLFALGYGVVFQITGASAGWRFPADVFANILPLLTVGGQGSAGDRLGVGDRTAGASAIAAHDDGRDLDDRDHGDRQHGLPPREQRHR